MTESVGVVPFFSSGYGSSTLIGGEEDDGGEGALVFLHNRSL